MGCPSAADASVVLRWEAERTPRRDRGVEVSPVDEGRRKVERAGKTRLITALCPVCLKRLWATIV